MCIRDSSYTDQNGNRKTKIDHVRIRWKPWEYYYEDEARVPMTDEDLRDYIDNGTLNSRDTNRAFRLRDEYRFQEEGIPIPLIEETYKL